MQRLGDSAGTPMLEPTADRPRRSVRDGRCDAKTRAMRLLVLPDPNDGPTHLGQTSIGVAVTCAICIKLLSPPGRVLSRPSAVFRTAVPEATIDEDHDALRREDDVAAAPETWQGVINAEPKARPMERGSDPEFWSSVASALLLHPSQRLG